jgi:hypothetical protein
MLFLINQLRMLTLAIAFVVLVLSRVGSILLLWLVRFEFFLIACAGTTCTESAPFSVAATLGRVVLLLLRSLVSLLGLHFNTIQNKNLQNL